MKYCLSQKDNKVYITEYGKSVGTGLILHLDELDEEFLLSLKNCLDRELIKRNFKLK